MGATRIRNRAAPEAIVMARHPQVLPLCAERATVDDPTFDGSPELHAAGHLGLVEALP